MTSTTCTCHSCMNITKETKNTEAPCWERVQEATVRFLGFLRLAVEKGPLSDWHVIFSLGTVVRIKDGTPEFTGFNLLSHPTEREHFASDKGEQEVHENNVRTWEKQSSHPDPNIRQAIRRGYYLLTQDGYPYPGGEGSDRMPMPIERIGDTTDVAWMVMWLYRNANVFSLALQPDGGKAAVFSGTTRRMDYLSPRVYAVISPTLHVTILA